MNFGPFDGPWSLSRKTVEFKKKAQDKRNQVAVRKQGENQ